MGYRMDVAWDMGIRDGFGDIDTGWAMGWDKVGYSYGMWGLWRWDGAVVVMGPGCCSDLSPKSLLCDMRNPTAAPLPFIHLGAQGGSIPQPPVITK